MGSNSAHLLVAAVEGRRVRPIVDESALLGLGSRIDSDLELGTVGRAELAAVLVRYADTARRLGATEITFVGTEPIRRATDAALIKEDVEHASGVTLHSLSHDEEGYLTLLGVATERRVAPGLAIVDIGGGSTELVLVEGGCEIVVSGLQIGSARLTDRVVEHDPPTEIELGVMRDEARLALGAMRPASPGEMVAVGGTASNLARVLPSASLDGTLTDRRLGEVLGILAGEPAAVAAERHALRPTRARILPAGAAILRAVMEFYGLDRVSVMDPGIREGLVLATAFSGASWRDTLPQLAKQICTGPRRRTIRPVGPL